MPSTAARAIPAGYPRDVPARAAREGAQGESRCGVGAIEREGRSGRRRGRVGESDGADHPGAAKDVFVTLLVFLLYLVPKGERGRDGTPAGAVIKYRGRRRPCVESAGTVQ